MGIRIPQFTYENGDAVAYSGEKYWYIVCQTSGTLKLKYDKKIDVFMVGSGGGGGSGNGAAGGGGGYVKTVKGLPVAKETAYSIVIGEGGKAAKWTAGGRGGTTSAFGHSALGGYGGGLHNDPDGLHNVGADGGAGGSGGGAGIYIKGEDAGAGGSNGRDGGSTSQGEGGAGKHVSTYGFGEQSTTDVLKDVNGNTSDYNPYMLFAGGGGGSSRNEAGGNAGAGGGKGGGEKPGKEDEPGGDGLANRGGGGGGASWNGKGGNGGSGVVIIRSTMPDYLPVYFNGTRLTDIYYQMGNGGTRYKLDTLTFNSTKLY